MNHLVNVPIVIQVHKKATSKKHFTQKETPLSILLPIQ